MAPPSERPTAEQIELAEAQIVEQSKRIDFFLTEDGPVLSFYTRLVRGSGR